MSKIDSLESYLVSLQEYEGKTVIFRGLDKPFKKLSTVVRSFCSCSQIDHGCDDLENIDSWYDDWNNNRKANSGLIDTFKKYEKTLFDSFKRQARIYLEKHPTNDWEWLAYAQHYGLRTRFLDWSKNPLAALYFSISNQTNKSDVWVYIYDFGNLTEGHQNMIDLNAPPSESPLDYTGELNRFIPPVIDNRMATQQSVFTIQEDPFEVIKDDNIKELVIERDKKESIRKQLHRIGINQVSLFPNLDGLCENLTWVWEQYRGA